MNVVFHTNQICLRGTEIALFDYAHFNETLLGNRSIILSRENKLSERGGPGKNQPLALAKFKERFPLVLYKDVSDIDRILRAQEADVLYAIKEGIRDGVESQETKTVIHTVFKHYEPHGDVYAYVSQWLSDLMTQGRAPVVPHMIYLPKVDGDLRGELGIPADATVFGRYGGANSFDVPFVHQTVQRFAAQNPDCYFLFMNTDSFIDARTSLLERFTSRFRSLPLNQIVFLPGTADLTDKSRFINTCNAMLHARKRGETFGIAVGEFSVSNVPVLTYGGGKSARFESNHIEILGDKGFVYDSAAELVELLTYVKNNRSKLKSRQWDAYSSDFSPAVVMDRFQSVFLR